MVGALIGTGLKAAGSIAGGIMGVRSADKANEALEKQRQENRDWFNRRYNEDPTQRASAQRMITMVTDAVRNRNKAVAGTQAVMGGTDASVAAEKEANNRMLAETISGVAAAGDADKDAIEAAYRGRDAEITGQQIANEQAKTAEIAKAVTGVADAAAPVGVAVDEFIEAKKNTKV